MKKIFFYWALFGLIIEFTLNVSAHLLDIDLTENLTYPWTLHLSIIVLILLLKYKKQDLFQKTEKINSFVFHNSPGWFNYIVLLSFVYYFLNFILFAINTNGDPIIENGKYILSHKGKLSKVITENEYHHFKAVHLGLITSPFIVIYSIIVALLWPYHKKESSNL